MNLSGSQESTIALSDAIIVKNVSKRYKIPHEKKRTMYDNLLGVVKGNKYGYDEFWALKDVSFTIKRGETVGVIGENGSGKSTLLKIIAGVLHPDSGNVTINGKIAPFLELGVGFQPDLTAKENIILYGSIMGMSRKQINGKLDYIFEFSELEKFRNAKLKNFSSGMYARLAFSTAISTNPDILLIDEALSVGDETFQHKCSDKINEFRAEKKTIVLVSHSLGTISQLCKKTVLLNHGIVSSIGDSDQVISDYQISNIIKEENTLKKEHDKAREQQTRPEVNQLSDSSDDQNTTSVIPPETLVRDRWGSGEIEIENVTFCDKEGREKHVFKTAEPFIVRMKYRAKTMIEKPVFGIAINRSDGVHITGPNTKFHKSVIDSVEGEGTIEYIVDSLPLLDGSYLFTVAIFDFDCVKPYDFIEKRFKFRVTNNEIRDYGLVYLPCRWKYEK